VCTLLGYLSLSGKVNVILILGGGSTILLNNVIGVVKLLQFLRYVD